MTLDLPSLAKLLTVEDAATLLTLVKENQPQTKRFGLFPLIHRDKYERALTMASNFWAASVIDFKKDRNDFFALSKETRQPLIKAFGFFNAFDGVAIEVIFDHLLNSADSPEEKFFYANQASNECTHNEAYGAMIADLVDDPKERERIFDAVNSIPSLIRIKEWVFTHLLAREGKKRLYAGLVFMERAMFMPLFCIIFWYKFYHEGKLIQIMTSNEWIARDEALHTLNGAANYRSLPAEERYNDEQIHAIFQSGYEVMKGFVEDIFVDIKLQGMSPEILDEYIRFIIDELLNLMGHKAMFGINENPIIWMTMLDLDAKSNFFEKTVTDYMRFNVNEAMKLADRRSGIEIIEEEESEVFF